MSYFHILIDYHSVNPQSINPPRHRSTGNKAQLNMEESGCRHWESMKAFVENTANLR